METAFREIRPADNSSIAGIIRTVMPEFGVDRPGFAIFDPEVDHMYEAYQKPRSSYLVCEVDGVVIGGAGIAGLAGSKNEICELQKMYFLPGARGKGLGQQMLQRCLEEAKRFGYTQCYIETFHSMHAAIRLYEANGFKSITTPLGATGHFGCDAFYLLDLDSTSKPGT